MRKKMKIIIDIPETAYRLLNNGGVDWLGTEYILSAVAKGTPLPKGHGRLGDLDKIKKEMQNYHDDCAKTSKYTRLGFETAMAVVEDAPTIIEADWKE
jgi:hypothetical protein